MTRGGDRRKRSRIKSNPETPVLPPCPTFLDRVVQSLFPQHRERHPGTGLTEDIGAAEPTAVIESEVKIAAKKIAIKKALGLDVVTGIAIKTAALNVSYQISVGSSSIFLKVLKLPINLYLCRHNWIILS